MTSGSQLVAARSLLLGKGWPGGPWGPGLGTTPCCWWSRGCSGCSRCCGWCYCSLRRPGQPPPPRAPACWGDLGAGAEVRAPARAPHSPRGFARLPQAVVEGPAHSRWGPGILTRVRVDEPERGGEQGPDEEGAKGDAQHGGQDERFACATEGGTVSSAAFPRPPALLRWPEHRVGASPSSATALASLNFSLLM